MENASKALLFAGGVLISLIIISMLVLMYNSLTSYQQSDIQNERDAQILQFNQQYEGYVRDDVRGNELFSLISKAIDYNNRESSLVTDTNQFEPMEIMFTFKGQDISNLKKNDTFLLFKDLNSNKNKEFTYKKSAYGDSLYSETFGIINKLTENNIQGSNNNMNNVKFSQESLDRLVTGYNKIFVDYFSEKDIKGKAEVFLNFNSALGVDFFKVTDSNGNLLQDDDLNKLWKYLDSNTDEIRKAVNTYYEYVQFKRAIFKCNSSTVRYSPTGRIVYLEFEFTGKYN